MTTLPSTFFTLALLGAAACGCSPAPTSEVCDKYVACERNAAEALERELTPGLEDRYGGGGSCFLGNDVDGLFKAERVLEACERECIMGIVDIRAELIDANEEGELCE